MGQGKKVCDFGHAIFADGYYKKVSGKVPVIQDEN